jgi:hypothetical protein
VGAGRTADSAPVESGGRGCVGVCWPCGDGGTVCGAEARIYCVQTSSSAATVLQSPSSRFIPTSAIQDIIIHEAFRGFEVRFYLAIVVKGEQDIIVVFPSLLPKRAILEEVWRGTRRCLWESGSRLKMRDEGEVK